MNTHILTRSFAVALVAPLVFAAGAFAENKLPEIKVDDKALVRNEHNSYAPIVEKVSPSVVTISVNKQVLLGGRGQQQNPFSDDPFFRRFFGIPDEEAPAKRGDGKPGRKKSVPVGMGSGVIVSPDGYILTNNHVVEQADELVVTLADGKTEFKAKRIGTDPGSDMAVIKVEANDLKAITFADSEKIKVGDKVMAIGAPFALRQSVTQGIVSALGRNETGISEFGNFIQTDASINPGNSGGALVDTEGRLIGINTAIFSRSGGNMGIGFAVPSNQARTAMESLIKFGKVQRGFLGIQMQELDEKLAKEFKAPSKEGILVAEVVPGGGAEKGGVKSGDVIVEFNGQKATAIAEFRNAIANMAPGTKVELKIFRSGEEKRLSLTLAERPGTFAKNGAPSEPQKEDDKAPDVLDGVTVGDIKPEMRKQFGIPEDVKGAIITAINPDSATAETDVKVGDVVVEIDGKPVKDSDAAVKLSEEVKHKNSVRIRVNSRGATRFVVIEEKKEN